jgi:peptidoglycan DL-endopeptidase CwlO
MVPIPSRRLLAKALKLLIAVLVLVATVASPSLAAPGDPTTPPNEGNENMTLGQLLEAANAAWLEAKALLEASKQRQAELAGQMAATERELVPLQAEVNTIAAAAYRTGGLRTAAAVLESESPDTFMTRSILIGTVAIHSDRELHRLNKLKADIAEAKKAIDAEVANQQAQADIMAKKKQDTEKALAAAGGRATGGFVSANSPLAKPAPRSANGTWPRESCIIDDPTTSGCLTPRTLHALQEARRAGFTRYTACYRPGGPYEHPKGRACDFSATTNGFGGVATGDDRFYGNNLAAYFVRNANALAVLYVIWYRQVWTPSVGWHAYNQGGDPSSAHTNHVHLSVI